MIRRDKHDLKRKIHRELRFHMNFWAVPRLPLRGTAARLPHLDPRSHRKLQKSFNVTSEDFIHLLSLAYTLIAERRNPDSVFHDWRLGLSFPLACGEAQRYST